MAVFTAGDQINGALRLIGQLAEGEVPTAATSQDALAALNQMLESWSIESLSVYNTQDQVFTWPASTLSRTLGPTGDFVGNRPISLESSTYFRDASTNVSYGIQMVNQDMYDGIAVKTVTSTYPQIMWINPEFPNIEMRLYPVPTRALEFHFISYEELSQPALLSTSLYFPPGYNRAFRFNLACELAAEFGVEPSAQVKRIAMTSKRNIKRINNPGDLLSMPYSLINTTQKYNIFSNNF